MRPLPFLSTAFLGMLVAGGSPLVAQDEIVVRGSSKFDIAIRPFQGTNGVAVATDVGKLLRESGLFNIVGGGPSAFAVQGSGNGSAIEGALLSPQGQGLFRKSYRAPQMRANVNAFADDIISAITGSPGITSSMIVFVGRVGGRKEIFTCDYDGGSVRQLTRDAGISVSPSISRTAGYVAYTSYSSGYPDIYTIDLGSGVRRRVINAPGTNGGAAISPDGGLLAVTMSFSGNKELYITNRGGGRPRSLTRTSASESSPTWSPDGSELIYSADPGGSPQLFRISASGGAPRRLNVGFAYCTEPDWSPDGNRLAFSAKSGGSVAVVVHDLRTGRSTLLRDGEDPSWGPDSRHLVFTSGGALLRMNVDTRQTKRLASQVGGISEPSWSHR